jgi:putative ABC transport system permease protein
MRKTSPDVQVLQAARQVVASIDPDRPVIDARPMDVLLAGALWARHGYIVVLGVFACAATLLAAIGIYGVTTYSVARRTREIGIRIALGASARDIVRVIGRGVMTMVTLGVAIGVVAALPLTQLISSQLWGVTPTDPATFAAVIALIIVVALVACWLPVRRALRVDPTIALRCE